MRYLYADWNCPVQRGKLMLWERGELLNVLRQVRGDGICSVHVDSLAYVGARREFMFSNRRKEEYVPAYADG